MKKLIILLALAGVLATAGIANAAEIRWDYDEYHDKADGYTVYFSDGTADYNYTFPADEATVDEDAGRVVWGPIEDKLNLATGAEYSFSLTRYNDKGESDSSNTVTYTLEPYSPPTDQLPDPVTSEPSSINGLGVN